MTCPTCGGRIFENYSERKTVSVVGVGLDGFPVLGDDASICCTDITSYNCADCLTFWDSWPALLSAAALAQLRESRTR